MSMLFLTPKESLDYQTLMEIKSELENSQMEAADDPMELELIQWKITLLTRRLRRCIRSC